MAVSSSALGGESGTVPKTGQKVFKTAQEAPCSTDNNGPSLPSLVVAGVFMIPAEMLLRNALHELSHAGVATAHGFTVTKLHLIPHNDPDGFFWADVHYRERGDTTTKATILLAPKALDVLLLSAYSAALETDSLPNNKYAQLALAIMAVGAAWDLETYLFSNGGTHGDTNRLFEHYHFSSGERLAFKLAQGTLTLAGGIEAGRGLYRALKPDEKPKASTTGQKYGAPIIGAGFVGWGGRF